jgi:hypothetical protein
MTKIPAPATPTPNAPAKRALAVNATPATPTESAATVAKDGKQLKTNTQAAEPADVDFDQALEAATAQVAAAPAKGAPYFASKSGGFNVTWTADDIKAEPTGGGAPYSWKNALEDAVETGEGPIPAEGNATATVKMRSLVGSYMGLESHASGNVPGTPHDWGNSSLSTLDLRTGKAAALTDLFSKKDLYKALMADKVVQQTLGSAHPKDFDALMTALDGKGDAQGKFVFSKANFLKNFALHHAEGKQVAVRIGLPYGDEMHRNTLTELGLMLPAPKALEADIAAAQSGKAGAFTPELAKRVKGKPLVTAERKVD